MWKISSWDDKTKTGTIQGPHLGPLPFSGEGPYALGEEVTATLGTDASGNRTVLGVEPLKARQPAGTTRSVFEAVNQLQLWDWQLGGLEGGRLTILGSTDFSYYHKAEIVFHEVELICCPTYFSDAHFRAASDEERGRFAESREWESEMFAIVTDHGNGPDGTLYFVCAQRAECRIGTVYDYRRENLQPGERIASWVK